MNYSIDVENITVELLLEIGRAWPKWESSHPYQLVKVDQVSENIKSVVVCFPVDSNSTSISIRNFNKTDNDTVINNGIIVKDQNLAVNKVWVNDIQLELLSLLPAFNFSPSYSDQNVQYAKDNNITLEPVIHTTKMYYNGTWTFNFKRPFFIWYNQLVLDSVSAFNNWTKASHLGTLDAEPYAKELKKLYNKLI